jgi:hypothetical protein
MIKQSRHEMFRLRFLQVLILLAPLPFGSAGEPFTTLFLLLLVIWTALAWPDMEAVSSLPGGRRLERFILAIPFLAFLQVIPMPRGMVGFFHPGVQPLLESLPMESGQWLSLSLAPGVTLGVAFKLLALALFFLTLMRLPLGRVEARGISTALLVSAAFQALVGGARLLSPMGDFFLFFYPIKNPQPWQRLTGTFVDSAQTALFLGMAFLAGLGLWAAEAGLFSSRGPRPVTLKQWVVPGKFGFFRFFMAGICALGFVLIRDKNLAWLMAGAGTVLVLLWLFTQFYPQQRLKLHWIFLAAMVMALLMGINRTQPQFQDQRTGTGIHLDTTKALSETIRDYPVFGSGWGTFVGLNPVYINRPEIRISHARNDWLELTAEGGILTLLLLAVSLILYFRGFWKGWRECPDRWARGAAAGMLAAILLLFGMAFFHYPLRVPGLFFPGMILMAVALRLVNSREETR